MNVEDMSIEQIAALLTERKAKDKAEKLASSPRVIVRSLGVADSVRVIRDALDAMIAHGATKAEYALVRARYYWQVKGTRKSETIKLPDGTHAYRLIWSIKPSPTDDELSATWQAMSESSRIACYLDAVEYGRFMPTEIDRALARKPADGKKA